MSFIALLPGILLYSIHEVKKILKPTTKAEVLPQGQQMASLPSGGAPLQ